MSYIPRRTAALLGATATTVMALAGTAAASIPTPAPPGDNGTVKVHQTTTSATDRRNEPHVCGFYLVGFNFDPSEQVGWRIVEWAPTGDKKTVSAAGTLVLDANGHGRTTDLSLPDGHYKLYWNFKGEHGFAKQKVFWVKCQKPPTSPPPSATMTPTPTVSPSTTPTDSASPSATPSKTPSEGVGQPSDSTSPPAEQPVQSDEKGGDLPLTGFTGRLLASIGVALILGGAGAILIAHHRRGRHSSASG